MPRWVEVSAVIESGRSNSGEAPGAIRGIPAMGGDTLSERQATAPTLGGPETASARVCT